MNLDRILNYSAAIFQGIINPQTQKPLKWFFCFGTLLHIIRDNCLVKDDDIDIGIFYEDYEPHILENSFSARGMQIKNKIINDIDKKPLKYTVTAPGLGLHFDVFCWYKHKNIRYHTYDIEHEKKEKPSKYTFKGIPAEYIEGKCWDYSLNSSLRIIKLPCDYGACLDIWYPDWLKKRKGVSETRHLIQMKSCSGFLTEKYEKVIAKSKVNGEEYLDGEVLCNDSGN